MKPTHSKDPVKREETSERVQPSRTLKILRQLRDESPAEALADAELLEDPQPEDEVALAVGPIQLPVRRPVMYRGAAPVTRR